MNSNDDDKLLNADLGSIYNTNQIFKSYDFNDNEPAVNTNNTNLKRKLSADNLAKDTFESKITKSKSSGQFSMFSGLNVQLVDKNDKKFIKLNLNNSSNDKLKATTSAQAANYQYYKTNMITELDDLPSESDLSSGMTFFLPTTTTTLKNQQLIHSIKTVAPAAAVEKVVTNQHQQQQHKTVAIFYKCNQCSNVFDNESAFKSHQNRLTCMQSMINNMKSQDEDSDTNQQQQQQQHTQTSFKVTKQRSFICNECGKLFQTQACVSKHMRQEHNDKPFESASWSTKLFKCYICSLDFTLATSLKSHLHKVHAKKIDHEFDDIDRQKTASSAHEQSKQGFEINTSKSSNELDANNNTVLYIKDPTNKIAEIQHMVVYVDGKPIFVQNPKTTSDQTNSVPNEQSNDVLKIKTFQKRTHKLANESDKTLGLRPKASSSKSAQNSAPVAKIPYLLARAAAAAASSHRQQQASNMQKCQHQESSSSSARVICHGGNGSTTAKPILSGNSKRAPTGGSNIELKHDQEYLQLVSMLRQKNKKLLFNPQILNRN